MELKSNTVAIKDIKEKINTLFTENIYYLSDCVCESDAEEEMSKFFEDFKSVGEDMMYYFDCGIITKSDYNELLKSFGRAFSVACHIRDLYRDKR